MRELIRRRRAADLAFLDARRRERRWDDATRSVRAWGRRHREAVIVGAGFTTGLATSLLPLASLMRLASAFAGTVSLMLEGPFLRMLAAQRQSTSPTPHPPPANAP